MYEMEGERGETGIKKNTTKKCITRKKEEEKKTKIKERKIQEEGEKDRKKERVSNQPTNPNKGRQKSNMCGHL